MKKIKVGFHLENKGYPNVDLREPEKGNPGIGGTEYTTVTTAYYLNKFYPDQIECLLLASSTKLLPPSLSVIQAESEVDAAVKSKTQGCDIFVFKSPKANHEIYEELRNLNIKAIARSNNTPDIEGLKQIADSSQIKCHVCVGQEQLDFLRDHIIFKKSTRIFNPFNAENFIPKQEIVKRGNTVVFLGNIIPVKGFHYLARVWRNVLKKRPDAKLIVIGSGKLYERSNKLGKWGVAEENYEANCIRPFLSDVNGDIIDSVHFAGLLGEEKIEILQNADVGVVNPSGKTEVCPASALEIQACGTPVISAAKEGILDTVIHGKTGLLGKSDKALVRNILCILDNPSVAKQFGENGINFVKDNFAPPLIAQQWLDLFIDICNGRTPQQQPMKDNYLYKAKFLREGIRVLKTSVPLGERIPALLEVSSSLRTSLSKIKL
jgi:glycosyltransferase involved in cell wall biosynthesis